MTAMVKRWYRFRRNQIVLLVVVLLCILYYLSVNGDPRLPREDMDISRSTATNFVPVKAMVNLPPFEPSNPNNRDSVHEYIERKLVEALKQDKGTGCHIPKLNPFAKEVTQFDFDVPKIVCEGTDWVKCYRSECRVVDAILKTTTGISCSYKDIIYESDRKYYLSNAVEVSGDGVYTLTRSDHAKVKCTGKHIGNILPSRWSGHVIGFRGTVTPEKPPPGREDTLNVLIFGFDSTAHNGFMRKMPNSYEYLTKKMKATVLEGYNIVGDGTPAALFPILSGTTELELPDMRKKVSNDRTLDVVPFVFYKLKDDGYRTAYFEDMPWIGTFQYRFNGFKKQPADHYLRAFYLEESSSGKKWSSKNKYCVGDTPQYKLMMNITEQFLELDGKRFCFTFIADITHDDNMIGTADDDFVEFLKRFMETGKNEDTLLFVMGDHGPRFIKVRETLQGKLEERLPLMAILLPEKLKRQRPNALNNLRLNAKVLTTPHDIYATVMDALDMRQHWNPYKVEGADLTRGLTLLEPIPSNRSCSEAGVQPHWCACLAWNNVSSEDNIYAAAANALLRHINALTSDVRSLCAARTLTSIEWVMRQGANNHVLSFVGAKDADGYVGKFGGKTQVAKESYQVKIVVGPGRGMYEASMQYSVADDEFFIDTWDISRTNAYGNEPHCISDLHPHLNMFCYCND